MRINFLYLRFRNFLSTGSTFIEYDFTKTRNTLIVGQNGGGKSQLEDAICFVLFNRAFRNIKKPQLVNSVVGKGLLVEIEFTVGGKHYKVVRGIKPAVFEIWRDGELLNQDAKNTDYQSYLEKNILKTNFKTFCQIVILGSASYVPFMELKTGERREITEDVLDLQIFSNMNTVLKAKLSALDKAMFKNEADVKLLSEKLRLVSEHTAELIEGKLKVAVEKETTIRDLRDSIKRVQKGVDAKMKEIELLKLDVVDQQEKLKLKKKVETFTAHASQKIQSICSEIEFLEKNEVCPSCQQGITHEHRTTSIAEKNALHAKMLEGIELLSKDYREIEARLAEIDEVNKAIAAINVDVYAANVEITGLNRQIDLLQQEIDQLRSGAKSLEKYSDKEALENELKVCTALKADYIRDHYMMSYVSVLLKDTGIKAKVIRQFIPFINKHINDNLAKLEFLCHFELDENFEETIRARGRENFTYSSFSEGEKFRINLAILFAWRTVARLRSSMSTNLLILDEVMDGSLDTNGVDDFLTMLSALTDDTNTFIISHRGDQIQDRFDRVLEFSKVKNFSVMTER